MLLLVRARLLLVASWTLGCTPSQTAATPPPYAAPSTLVRGDEGINALASEACAMPCQDPLPTFAREIRDSAGGVRFVELEPSRCLVPGMRAAPAECIATCGPENQVEAFTVDFGPIGPNTRRELCQALENDRGVPARGSCEDVCESAGGCSWNQTEQRGELEFVGHVALKCPLLATLQDPSDFFEPNHSDASNSMSP